MIERKDFSFQVKAVSDDGFFSGYLSVFGVVDAYRDIVMPGAFAESLARWQEKKMLPPVLWQHRSGEPIGPFTKMVEDGRGLYVEGKLLVNEVQRAKEAHALLKAGAISGMSIGYETIGEEIDKEQRARKLTKLELWEGSIVTFPANPDARVDAVKAAAADLASAIEWLDKAIKLHQAHMDGTEPTTEASQMKMMRQMKKAMGFLNGDTSSMKSFIELPNLKEFEGFLREAGFSKTQAAAIASRGLAHVLRSESGTPDGDQLTADIKAAITELYQGAQS